MNNKTLPKSSPQSTGNGEWDEKVMMVIFLLTLHSRLTSRTHAGMSYFVYLFFTEKNKESFMLLSTLQ